MIKFLKIALVITCFFLTYQTNAQFVNIPDPNFRLWLNNNGYASCMNGNDMDTTCALVVNATKVNCPSSSISDLTGIQYFDNLDTLICRSNPGITIFPTINSSLLYLDCSNTSISSLPSLPSSLQRFECRALNGLTALPSLPSGITLLDCSFNEITVLPALPSAITLLACDANNLTFIPTLPSTLTQLSCSDNGLTSLPNLPGNMWSLVCSYNQISNLPTLPSSLTWLECTNNQISSLPNLSQVNLLNCSYNLISVLPSSSNLGNLNISHNLFTSLPTIPGTVGIFNCSNNFITSLPSLPLSITQLKCSHNLITSLPSLPPPLAILDCSYNPISSLPILNSSLLVLTCDSTQVTGLPQIPQTLSSLSIQYCQIPVLPELPDTLNKLDISSTLISCLPHILKINTFYWGGSNLSCLPNAISIANIFPINPPLGLCQPSGNCPTFWNIKGNIYKDLNSNCVNDSEDNLRYIPVRLDSSGYTLQSFYTNTNGDFSFRTSNGTYSVIIDTTQLPFDVFCPPSFSYISTIFNANTYDSLANFGLECETGFDLISQSITPLNLFRPGAQRYIEVDAGDAALLYGSPCATGISGSVRVILDGPVSYISPASGANAPTAINGDTLTWIVADFSQTDPSTDFDFISEVPTTATSNDTICIQLDVFPASGDNNILNNSLTSCFPIVNSYDPNLKYMSPSGAVDTSQYWFTNTIFFQNTGNAFAENIYLIDSLSINFEASTFSFLSSSHDVTTQLLPGNVLRFNYPNINLADSTSNEPESHGYVQFKIKRKPGLPVGTSITNKAYIYFDYNTAIITNTATATLTLPVSVDDKNEPIVGLYPNPTNDLLQVTSTSLFSSLEVFNLQGKIIQQYLFGKDIYCSEIGVSHLANGVYFVKLVSEKNSIVKKIIKQ